MKEATNQWFGTFIKAVNVSKPHLLHLKITVFTVA